MLKTIQLFLPALIPSWRFFQEIAPSPRIEVATLSSEDEVAQDWTAFNPRPGHVSVPQMLTRMVWNPIWNEMLYLVSLCERVVISQNHHAAREIALRIQRTVSEGGFFQYRLVFVTNNECEVVYISPVYPAYGEISS